MNVEAINSVMRDEQPDQMSVASFDSAGRKLVLRFEINGGPREDEEFVVEFNEAVIFHLPSVFHAPIFFRRTDARERVGLIPPASYDSAELSGEPGAFTVVAIDDAHGTPLGYYVAAASVSTAWRRRRT